MKCPQCQQETPDRSKACQYCKAPLYPVQCYCGEWNTAKARFCIQCQRDLLWIKKKIEYAWLFDFRLGIMTIAWLLFFIITLIPLLLRWLTLGRSYLWEALVMLGIYLLFFSICATLLLIAVEMGFRIWLKKRKLLNGWAKRKRVEDFIFLLLIPFSGLVMALSLGQLLVEWNLPQHVDNISRAQSLFPFKFLYFGLWGGLAGGLSGFLIGIVVPSSGRYLYSSGNWALKLLISLVTVNVGGLIVVPKVFYGEYQEVGNFLQGLFISTTLGAIITFLLKKQIPLLGSIFWKILKVAVLSLMGFVVFFLLIGGLFYLLPFSNLTTISYWFSFFLIAVVWAELQAIFLNPIRKVVFQNQSESAKK